MNIPTKTQEFIKKIEWIVQNQPKFNLEKVGAAMQRHYELLGIKMPKIKVVQDLVIGFAETQNATADKDLNLAWRRTQGTVILSFNAECYSDEVTCPITLALGAFQSSSRNLARLAAWNAAMDVSSLKVLQNAERCAAWEAAPIACMLNADLDNPKLQRSLDIAIEIFKAFEQGLGFYIPLKEKLVLVPSPQMTIDEQERPHSTKKAAVDWRDGAKFYFLYGAQFEKPLWQKVVAQQLSFKEIMNLPNIDQQMAASKVYEMKKLIEDSNAKLVDHLEFKTRKFF